MIDEVVEMSANIDDMTGQDLGAAMDILFKEGALDVWFEHIQMKKNRPAVKLSLIVRPGEEKRIANVVLKHTTTLGVRMHRCTRVIMERETEVVRMGLGDVRIKKGLMNGSVVKEMPEYEDVLRISCETGKPLAEVRSEIMSTKKKYEKDMKYKEGD